MDTALPEVIATWNGAEAVSPPEWEDYGFGDDMILVDVPAWGTGLSGIPHTEDQGKYYFGDNFEGWSLCRAVVQYDLNNLKPGDQKIVKTMHDRWLCMNTRFPGSDYCEQHPDGITDEKKLKERQTKINRAEGLKAARAAKAAKAAKSKE